MLVALRNSRHISVVYPIFPRSRLRAPQRSRELGRDPNAVAPVSVRKPQPVPGIIYKCCAAQLSFSRYIYYTLCAGVSWRQNHGT
ncbi:hypothetical protein BN903_42 [Halorubrum sp. AJ67]|nr:hypothetical protein BN903_42 [Halorubrum sp. AJ67]